MRQHFLRIAAVFAVGVSLFLISGFAKTPLDPSGPLYEAVGGKYAAQDGGWILFSVDDYGQVEGYYERPGVFGEFFGRLQDGRVVGYWLADQAATDACEQPKRGRRHWGRLELTLESGEAFTGLAGVCEAAPESSDSWSARR